MNICSEQIKSMEETDVNFNGEIQKNSKFRRYLPQILGSGTINLTVLNVGQSAAFTSIVLSGLMGLSKELNPDETVTITSAQASWLAGLSFIAHPIGSLISGPICDKFGRRKPIMFVTLPLTIIWIILGFAESFVIICLLFTFVGFLMGLKDSPTIILIAEISEPQIRGIMMGITPFAYGLGVFIVMTFGSMYSWRQVSFICAVTPFICFISFFFIAESPYWLLSIHRPKDAQKSLQSLRGWVTPQMVHTEFTELQTFSNSSNACVACEKQSIKCYHPKPTFLDKIKSLKRSRVFKPSILMLCFVIFNEFSLFSIWQPYIVQVLIAVGSPIDPNMATIWNSGMGIVANVVLMLLIKKTGRRKLYFTSIAIVAICSIMLSIYTFILLPSGWTSFKKHPDELTPNLEKIREIVGTYSYLALTLISLMQFGARIGTASIPYIYFSEIFPFKLRAFMCALSIACDFSLASIATKTYYNVEMWLSLSGAMLFYGVFSFVGLILMYFIMPELEQRSLEDIELHYSDNSKGLTDIHVANVLKTSG